MNLELLKETLIKAYDLLAITNTKINTEKYNKEVECMELIDKALEELLKIKDS